MREFKVLVEMTVKASSFTKAEQLSHEVMIAGFSASKGENPIHFDTLSITRGKRISL